MLQVKTGDGVYIISVEDSPRKSVAGLAMKIKHGTKIRFFLGCYRDKYKRFSEDRIGNLSASQITVLD